MIEFIEKVIKRIARINKIFDGNLALDDKLKKLKFNIEKLNELAIELKSTNSEKEITRIGKRLEFSKSKSVYIPKAEGNGGGIVPDHRPVVLLESGIKRGIAFLRKGNNVINAVYSGNHNDNREHYRFQKTWQELQEKFDSKSALLVTIEKETGSIFYLEISDLSKRQG